MNETRAQFRDRIGRIAWRAFFETVPDQMETYRCEAEAVYAEALKDVLALLHEKTGWCQECGGGVDEIERLAAERGITLEGRDDE